MGRPRDGQPAGIAMKVKPVSEIVAFLAPVAETVGVELVDAEWDMRNRALTLFIDREGGIDLNVCEAFHRAVDGPLEELDPTFGEAYTLNCSSLGLDRPFKKEKDFLRHIGEKIEVRLYAPFEGSKYYEGELVSFEEGNVRLQTEKGEREIPFAKCAKVCLLIEV